MAEELTYVIITPHSLHKSRTGGIISRLLSRTGLELVAARMFAPSKELIQEYAKLIVSPKDPQDPRVQELIREYLLKEVMPDPKTGRRRRVMVLILKGEDAVRRTRDVVGNFKLEGEAGLTIRDTYGDLVFDEEGNVRYFEPAVLCPPTSEEAEQKLKLWARYSDTDGGVLKGVIEYPPGAKVEHTLVLIKPENFQVPSGKPGNMIDYFSRTGLYIIGIKVHRMSVRQAEEFYGPVREALKTKLNHIIMERAAPVLEKEFEFKISKAGMKKIAEVLAPEFGEDQFQRIIRFMCGRTRMDCPPEELDKPGTEKCIALVYEGVDAVRKIREVLGPTDPKKAPPGSIRREFGRDVMVNAAHASDSVENAEREMRIINIEENNFRKVVEDFYGSLN